MVGNLLKDISILWKQFSAGRKLHFKMLCILMIFVAFAEVLSIGAVFPFFGALMEPRKVFDSSLAAPIINFLNLEKPEEIILPMTILFSIAILLSSALRVLSTWLSVRFSFTIGSEISNDIYKRTLYQPYTVHVSRNSSEVINGIWIKVSEVIFYILMPVMTLLSSSVLVLALLSTLFLVTPSSALISIGALALIYAVIIKLTRQRLKANSVHIANESTNIIKNLQEGLSGIRDVLIDGSQKTFSESYRKTDHILRRAQGNNQIMTQIPNFILLALGMVLIAVLSYYLTLSGGFAQAMPSLVALTLGLQRLLPTTQQLYSSWSTITGSQASLKDVVQLLQQPYPDNMNKAPSSMPFTNSIDLKNVSFSYSQGSTLILNKISLKIKKGARVGFIGKTGCGKSTLIDIIMGLLQPTEGTLSVDETIVSPSNYRAWQSHVAHVPQNVFLADTTIARNIAFGISSELIDYERIKYAARQAKLADLIETWPAKYETRVGERGVQLSGGQCQRIGIARALYKNADVIVLDEATSALDNETEKDILKSIEVLSSDITIIMIAHRLNTLSFCDEIIELGKGGIISRKVI